MRWKVGVVILMAVWSADGLTAKPCQSVEGASTKQRCHYCQRTVVTYVNSMSDFEVIDEQAGCADDEDRDEMPPGLICITHLGENKTNRGSDFVMHFSARGDTELISKRCCENIHGMCNRKFAVLFPQKYLMRHIKREPPKLMAIFVICVLLIGYYIFRIATCRVNQMSADVTKKEQLRMYGYRDDPLEAAIIENMTKVEEPVNAVSKANAIPTFNGVLHAIFDIQYFANPPYYEDIWTQSLPKMKRDAKMRGLKPPADKGPVLFASGSLERQGTPFYELQKNPAKKTIFSEVIKHRTISSKILKQQNRPRPSGFTDFLFKLIEHGPYENMFKASELFNIFEKAKDQFAQDPTVLQLKNNFLIIGDIRGRYIDLFRIFNTFGWPPHRAYLFLGGIIENEEDQSLECMAMLATLKCALPHSIFLLRGVGETIPYVPGRRFPGVSGEVLGNSLARLCNVLPVAAVINSRILCTHSGVTTHFKGKSKLNNIQRPFTIDEMTEAGRRIIFAVPETNCRMFRMRPHEKNGEVFGSKAVQKTLQNMKLDLLIRSRSPIVEGYALHWDNQVLSIWSALTSGISRAAAVEVDPSSRVILHLFDTRATLTQDLAQRVTLNNVKAVEEAEGENQDESDEDFLVEQKHGSDNSSRKGKGEEAPAVTADDHLLSAKASHDDENKTVNLSERTASGKTGGDGKAGASKEVTVIKDSKESKDNTQEATTMVGDTDGPLNKTQDSISARGGKDFSHSGSPIEQKTQSVREWQGATTAPKTPLAAAKAGALGAGTKTQMQQLQPATAATAATAAAATAATQSVMKPAVQSMMQQQHTAHRRATAKKMEESNKKERTKRNKEEEEELALKTPDMSNKSEHPKTMMAPPPPEQTPPPTTDHAMSVKRAAKKEKEKELPDAILKSAYETLPLAVPLSKKPSDPRKTPAPMSTTCKVNLPTTGVNKSLMQDVSGKKRNEDKSPADLDSLRSHHGGKVKSRETIDDQLSKEQASKEGGWRELNEDRAFSEKSIMVKSTMPKRKKEEEKKKEEKKFVKDEKTQQNQK